MCRHKKSLYGWQRSFKVLSHQFLVPSQKNELLTLNSVLLT